MWLRAVSHPFVTKDDEEIVKKRDRLRTEVDIKIATLQQAVDQALAETERPNQPTNPATRHSEQNDLPGSWVVEPFWEPDQPIRSAHQQTSTVLWLQDQA